MAEEAVQDAFIAATERWPSAGLPPSPAGWIITTARNRAIDRLRREASRDDRHAEAQRIQAGRDETPPPAGGRGHPPPPRSLHFLTLLLAFPPRHPPLSPPLCTSSP